ncbi:MAG: MoaD/ThiS family protein [Anaerolineae bacterium CG03_land_8_20_14_0_80_58_20]|nr:MAG: MoaD/ThiS family protein [Anaerolineae bacterium CG03_land_8_20_14_0_80_58_20]
MSRLARRHECRALRGDMNVAVQESLVYFSVEAKGETFMKVNFYATLRAVVGKKTIEVDLKPQATARDLVEVVVTDYPSMRTELLDANNEFQSHMKFFINGREAVYLENKMNTVIQPDDKVDIFPPVGGG